MLGKSLARTGIDNNKRTWLHVKKELYKGRYVYLMLLPVLIYYATFHYIPMYGTIIAFKDFKPLKGIIGSPWIGMENFISFFGSYNFWQLLKNTIYLNILSILFAFPAPIILALLLNEVRSRFFKKAVQTVSYLPHFVSLVVIVGMLLDFLSTKGLVNNLIEMLGGERHAFMGDPDWFRTIYIASGIWQEVGWASIIYLAALTGIDPQLYEAAVVDGAGRWRQTLHITLPGLASTIIILLILNLGHIMSVGFEKVLLMQNPLNMETSDVISTFVYRRGLVLSDFSYAAAVDLFNSVINLLLLVTVNRISRRLTETSLW